jgi:hypothetical protein
LGEVFGFFSVSDGRPIQNSLESRCFLSAFNEFIFLPGEGEMVMFKKIDRILSFFSVLYNEQKIGSTPCLRIYDSALQLFRHKGT